MTAMDFFVLLVVVALAALTVVALQRVGAVHRRELLIKGARNRSAHTWTSTSD